MNLKIKMTEKTKHDDRTEYIHNNVCVCVFLNESSLYDNDSVFPLEFMM